MYDTKPTWILPEGGHPTPVAAATLADLYGQLVNPEYDLYRRGDVLYKLVEDKKTQAYKLQEITPNQFADFIERHFSVVKYGNRSFLESNVKTSIAKRVMACHEFLDKILEIELMTHAPALVVDYDNKLHAVEDYHADSKTLSAGKIKQDVELKYAVKLLKSLLSDYNFVAESDHSRAVAALLTPALVLGGLCKFRVPFTTVLADQSQTGKGFFLKIVTALYNETASTVTQKNGGTGSIEESFSTALLDGRPFISLDNLRGSLDSAIMESCATEETVYARVPYAKAVEIDPRRRMILATSNGVKLTRDFANRCNIIRITKNNPDYQFRTFPEGNILDHLKANTDLYMGAVFAIIKNWLECGRPCTNEGNHDFRNWAQALDWICINIMGCEPIAKDLESVKVSILNSDLILLRNIAIAVMCSKGDEAVVTTGDLLQLAVTSKISDISRNIVNQWQKDDKKKKASAAGHFSKLLKKIFTDNGVQENEDLAVGEFVVSYKIANKRVQGRSYKTTHFTFNKKVSAKEVTDYSSGYHIPEKCHSGNSGTVASLN